MELSNNEDNARYNNSYDNYNQGDRGYKSEFGNAVENNDNISEKANSVQTSYRYSRGKNGQNSTFSK